MKLILSIAGLRIALPEGLGALDGRLRRLYRHLLSTAEGPTDGELRVLYADGPPPPRPTSPTLSFVADQWVWGDFADDRLTLSDDRNLAVVSYERHSAAVAIHDDGEAALFVAAHHLFPIALGELLRASGRFPIHAAAVTGPGGGVLLVGDSGCGKSTFSYRAIEAGYRCVGDDGVILRQTPDGVVASAFYREFCLDPALLSAEDRSRAVAIEPAIDGPRHRFAVPPEAFVEECHIDRVFLLTAPDGSPTTRTPCPSSAAVAGLIAQNPLVLLHPRLAGAHLACLARLTRSAPGSRVRAGPEVLHSEQALLEALS